MAAIDQVMAGASWQRCRVHFMRNVLTRVSKASSAMVATTIRTIFAQPTGPLVREQVEVVATMLEPKLPDVAATLREAREGITAFADFPEAHWPKIWSTNPLERLNREVKRRTEVVGIFLCVGLGSGGPRWTAGRLVEVPRVTRNLCVEPCLVLTLLGPVPSAPRGWPRDLIAA